MEYRLFGAREVPRHFALVFETGDDVIAEMQRFVEEQNVMAAFFKGLGGFHAANLPPRAEEHGTEAAEAGEEQIG